MHARHRRPVRLGDHLHGHRPLPAANAAHRDRRRPGVLAVGVNGRQDVGERDHRDVRVGGGREDEVPVKQAVVVDDRQHRRTGRAQLGTPGGIEQEHFHRLVVGLRQGVSENRDGESLHRLPVREGQEATRAQVIEAIGGGPIGGVIPNRDDARVAVGPQDRDPRHGVRQVLGHDEVVREEDEFPGEVVIVHDRQQRVGAAEEGAGGTEREQFNGLIKFHEPVIRQLQAEESGRLPGSKLHRDVGQGDVIQTGRGRPIGPRAHRDECVPARAAAADHLNLHQPAFQSFAGEVVRERKPHQAVIVPNGHHRVGLVARQRVGAEGLQRQHQRPVALHSEIVQDGQPVGGEELTQAKGDIRIRAQQRQVVNALLGLKERVGAER